MTCEHIEQAIKKINGFTSKVGDHDASLYKKLSAIVNKEDIGTKLEVISRRPGTFLSGGHTDYQAIATYKTYDFPYIPDNYFLEFCNEIGTLLNDCDCQEMVSNDKEEAEGKKKVLEDENFYLEKQNAVMENGLEVSQSRANKKDNKLKTLRRDYEWIERKKNVSENENQKLKSELEQKEKEILSLQKQLAQSREENLTEKLRLPKQKLNDIIQKLGVEEKHARELRRAYEQLILAREDRDKKAIDSAEDRIEEIKEKYLKRKMEGKDLQKLCKKCEKVAELRVQFDRLGQQQYEFKTEFFASSLVPARFCNVL